MLHLHRAERADRLADALAEILATPPADPFTRDVISVPTRGIERWLSQRLSARLGASADRTDGVCAGVDFPFPGRLIGGALAAASGIDPEADPWLPERIVWPLLAVIDEQAGAPWLEPLIAHLASAPDRRFARVRQIAFLFAEYGVRRPELIQAWARGEDGSSRGDWQPELWRCLRDRLGVPSGAERLPEACRRLRREPDLVELPERLCLFGLTRLPSGYLQALDALGQRRDVHLLLLHPSAVLWDRVAAALPRRPGVPSSEQRPELQRSRDTTATLPTNRLLTSWGRDARELQLVLAAGTPAAEDHHVALLDSPAAPPTLLAAIQADIRADRSPPGEPLPGRPDQRLALARRDDSIRIHACHGRTRQVEVLREAILHLLASDPTLEPRDVIIMCPDIETFAPLIQASFGAGPAAREEEDEALPAGSAIDLRVRLADRSLRQTNPVLGVLARLLDLAAQRLTASQVLDLADTAPVRRRFRFDDDDLARLADWVSAGAIHWGLDAEHRRAYKLEAVEAGTWRAGMRRLMLGVTLSESGQRLYARVLPLDDVDSGAIDLAGRFAEFIDRLGLALDGLATAKTITEWTGALQAAAAGLATTTDWDAWQTAELERILEEVRAEAASAADSAELALPEIRALLAGRLAGRPTRANFRTGHMTVCTLVPMRSVPHRVVCLLGLDDGAFPRRAPRDGDNRLLDEPHVGDRDPRSEDRQLLLDAFLAAGERLIITYSGHDPRTNAPLPAAVPVGELLDAVDATACPADSRFGRARDQLVVHHPLQAFDQRNFVAGKLIEHAPWSFDEVSLEGAVALDGPRTEPQLFVNGPLPPAPEEPLALADLIAFVRHPARAFLRQRLGISVGTREDEIDDALPVELDNLERWEIGQRLLEGILAGVDPARCVQAEIARGTLPPEKLGIPVLQAIRDEAEPVLRQARAVGGLREPRSLETNLVLPGGRRLTGTVSGVRDNVLLSVSYSRLGPRHRLSAWVNLLALSAAHPEVPFEAVTVGRGRTRDFSAALARIRPLGGSTDERRERALQALEALVDVHARGLREALPLPCLAAAAYASARAGTRADEAAGAAAANREWQSQYNWPKEDAEPEHELVFGGRLSLEQLMAIEPATGELASGWPSDERSRFGRYALRLWAPLLAREEVEDL